LGELKLSLNLSELCKVSVPEGKSGKWRIEKFEIRDDDFQAKLFNMRYPSRAVRAGTYTRLMRDGAHGPMMSDTPAEIHDHAYAIYKAQELGGRILLNGLGIGCILKATLSFPNVTHVDVVELEQDIIDLVAPSYTDPRVHIHHADAYTIQWSKEDYWSVAWHDIWGDICSDNLQGMAKLHRKYGHKVQWQDSWCKYECKRQRGDY
jgi:hypothetical protein